MKMPDVKFDSILVRGGMDQITPTLSLDNGVARQSVNFECSISGGDTRIAGYERWDGRTSPSDSTNTRQMVSVASLVNTPAVGNTVTGDDSSATGVVAYLSGLKIGLTKVTGTFQIEVIKVGATTIGTIDNLTGGPETPLEDALFRNAVADIYRADIGAVPGSGSILGFEVLSDVGYAFRNNAGGTAVDIYKSSAAGWVNVPLYETVSFTAGGAATPADGDTLTQGGVTATIKRVVKNSGTWAGSDAAGQFIITTPAGGNFASGAATAGAVGVTLSGAEVALALSPSGRFEMIVGNFSGQAATERIYGCDGVNKAFEFDGDILVPLTTTASPETPEHIAKNRDYLILSVAASFFWSAPADPYDWSVLSGAGEKATGSNITGMKVMPGSASNSALCVTSRKHTGILYGNTATDFNFISFDEGAGAVEYSLQNMSQLFAFDDNGATSITASQDYGNFTSNSLTFSILPYIKTHRNLVSASTVNRDKSQYRIFFSDGYGIYVTVVNNKLMGSKPVYFPNPVTCATEGKFSNGNYYNFFGSTDGFIYQLDKGTSFDGDPIDYQLVLNYSHAKTPRVTKRWRLASVELNSETSAYIAFQLGYSIGYASSDYAQPGASDYTLYLSQTLWDSFTWDDFFWDARGLAPVRCKLGGTAENISLAFSGSYDYVEPFTINSILIHYTERRTMR